MDVPAMQRASEFGTLKLPYGIASTIRPESDEIR